MGATILRDLGVVRIKLMTNNPRKYNGITDYGLVITERVPLRITPNRENAAYLRAKQDRLGHLLGLGETDTESALQ